MKRRISSLGLRIYCLSLIVLGSCTYQSPQDFFDKAPRDSEIARVFHEQRSSFEELRVMAKADRIAHVGWYIGPGTDEQQIREYGLHISAIRLLQYKTLLRTLGPEVGIYSNRDSDTEEFLFLQSGTLAIASELGKGVLYLPGPLSRSDKIRSNLDDLRGLSVDTTYLHKIEPNWYIFFQNSD